MRGGLAGLALLAALLTPLWLVGSVGATTAPDNALQLAVPVPAVGALRGEQGVAEAPDETPDAAPDEASQEAPEINTEILSSLSVRRGERTIYVHQYAPSSVGGRFILRNAACEEARRVSTIYAPEPYLVETLVGDMRVLSRLVLEKQPEIGPEATQLEMIDAVLDVDERRCPQTLTPTGEPGVTLMEGRSTVRGTHLVYDNASGQGSLEGPVTLEREADEGGEPLSARADSMVFSLEDDSTFLRGNVTVEAGERVSEASEFEYDEASNIAYLRGGDEALAASREGSNVVSGAVIEYDLSTNDVVVSGSARGTLELDR